MRNPDRQRTVTHHIHEIVALRDEPLLVRALAVITVSASWCQIAWVIGPAKREGNDVIGYRRGGYTPL